MLKQKKKSKIKVSNNRFFKSNYKFSLYKDLKRISSLYKQHKLKYKIFLKIKQNNVFCTLKNIITNKILLVASAGKLKVNVSKKKLFFLQKKIILKFLRKIRFILKSYKYTIIFEFIGPLKLRRRILKHLKFLIRKKFSFFLTFRNLKIFNGCRPTKKKT